MRLFAGVDIGLRGGVAVLDERAQVLRACNMPLKSDPHGKQVIDTEALYNCFGDHDQTFTAFSLVAYEYVHSFGHESRSSCFSFGRSAGRVQAVLELLRLPAVEPTPQMWKAEILAGTKKDKAAAIGYCNARWPGFSKDHDGIADALCLAEYARRQVIGG